MNIKKNIMTDDHINSSFLLSKTTGILKLLFMETLQLKIY